MALLLLAAGLSFNLAAQDTNVDYATTLAAANRGDAKALYDLGRRYEKGLGVDRDLAAAAAAMRKSADQGYAPAEGQLGYYYGTGLGVNQDPAEALQWYQKAAAQGNAVAEFGMGNLYATGRGVPQDTDQAIQWWQKAAAQNLAEAETALGQCYFRQAITNHVRNTDAFRWLHQAAEAGDVNAMNNLAVLYEYGRGTPKDFKAAAVWYRRAANTGNFSAMANLGVLYLDGRGVGTDLIQAYVLFRLSAEHGNGIGKKYLLDYQEYHLLDTNQLATAEKMIADFRERKTSVSALRP